jgi:hypothetical protein
MSTSIHSAYRLKPGVDVFTLRREVMAKLVPGLLQARAQELVNRTVNHYNAQWAGAKEQKDFQEVLRAEQR